MYGSSDSDSDKDDLEGEDRVPGSSGMNYNERNHMNQISSKTGFSMGRIPTRQLQKPNDSQSAIDFKTLTQWALSQQPGDLVNILTSKLELIKQALSKEELPVDWIHFFALTFQKVIHKRTPKSLISHIMDVVAHSNFVEHHVPKFFKRVNENQQVLSALFSSFQALFDILEYIAIRFSDCTNKCYTCVSEMEDIGKHFNILREGNDLFNRCFQLRTKCCPIPLFDDMNDVESHASGWTRNRREKCIPNDDDESPPDDFKERSIFPDMEELETATAPFLRANKTKGPYRNLHHYTDVHFRLLREDYLSPLREGLKSYKQLSNDNQNLRFYHNVKLVKLVVSYSDGIYFIVKFDAKCLGDIRWELSKRFLFGSLLCFSKDDFESVMFATVVNREVTDLEKGLLEVCFQNNLEQVLTSSERDSFVIAETVSFFESYKHVLEGLQEVSKLPLDDYILDCSPEIIPPEYLRPTSRYDLSSIMKNEGEKVVQILDPSDWPHHDDTVLNAAQLEAVKLALTNELAIIQGPPGTGKTYVGLHLMELLLRNWSCDEKNESPILVVCYTNHALDQFLEGMLEFCEGGIIRVGGRSRSDKLESFNLKELRRNPKMDRRLQRSINTDLRESKKRLKKVSALINQYWQDSLDVDTNIQSVSDLKQELTPEQAHSLRDPSRSSGDGKEMNLWLKASNVSFENHLTKSAEKRLIDLILMEGEEMSDTILLESANVRIRFDYRVQIYRSWMRKYKEHQEELLEEFRTKPLKTEDDKIAMHDANEALKKISDNILEVEDIHPYLISDEILEKIKLCVQQECKLHLQLPIIKSWLLGCFHKVEEIMNEIEKLSKSELKSSQPNRVDDKKSFNDRIIIDESDDDAEVDNTLLGFRVSDEDDDDGVSIVDDDANEMIREFRDLAVDYKKAEKREVSLWQRAKMLNIEILDENEEKQEEEEDWQASNQMTYSKVFMLIEKANPMSKEEAQAIDDVWTLPLHKRYSLYKFWILEKKKGIAQQIINYTQVYNSFLELKKKALSQKDIAILRKARVIGMTTTGAARYRAVLQQVRPQIIIVEEAAEVFEAHIVTTLNRHCKHLILIGDHQQLRPNPTVHSLAVDYELEISLFERLIKNNVKHITLQVQHRMRPEISRYLLSVYPKLRDHPNVSLYDNVKGMGSNVFFLMHNYRESEILETRSKANMHEAQFLTKLCKYLFQQGYTDRQITILAAYSGQVATLKMCMEPDEDLFKHVRVTSIDNYQGEENDIILLSLVRSNLEQEVGFLKTNNRICVALSRAKQGLFVIGNICQLENKSKLWQRIAIKARETNDLGVFLKLVCENHDHRETFIQHAQEFEQKVPEGGCDQRCEAELYCGHKCRRMCHISDPLHQEMFCIEPCPLTCPQGHPCPKKCWQECGDCEIIVKKEMPMCGHRDHIQCYVDPLDAICKQKCNQTLPCSHLCKGFCGDCSKSSQHADCEELVGKIWSPCGDKNTVTCCTDVKVTPCPAKCREKLKCGDICKGTCGGCLTKRVHKPCQAKCKKALPCGHQCQSKCSMPCEPCEMRCPTLCRHATCSKTTCGEICEMCKEDCAFVCRHRKCSDKCANECKGKPCPERCSESTNACKHSCSSRCGEKCVCYKCDVKSFRLIDFSKSTPGNICFAEKERAMKFEHDKDTILMKIPRCDHVFTMKQLDQYVDRYDPDGTSYIRCPHRNCNHTLQGIIKYDKINKQRANIRENRKIRLEELSNVSAKVIEELQFSLNIIDHFCPFDLDNYLSNRNTTIRKSHADALRMHSRFAYVLCIIVQLHQELNPGLPFNADKWKNVLKSHQHGITPQFEEEMTMELHRLLILEQFVSCHHMIDEAGVNIPENLKNQYKDMRKHKITKRLTKEILKESESIVANLMVELSLNAMAATKKNVEKLSMMSYLAKTILGNPNQKYLHTILEEEDILPVLMDDSLSEESDDDNDDELSECCSEDEADGQRYEPEDLSQDSLVVI